MPEQETKNHLSLKESEPKASEFTTIVLVTDFGDDLALAECKLSLLSVFKENNVSPLDPVTVNDVVKFNIVHAAFNFCRLASIAPEGTIFVGVIDPGVGTQRKSVVIQTENNLFFVGPDNGIFYPAASQQGIKTVWQIDDSCFPNASTTFHGRDIFSKAAAKIACGINPDSFAWQMDPEELIALNFQENQVVHIDDYGNLKVFNQIPEEVRALTLQMSDPLQIPITNTFEDVGIGEPLAYLGSSGLLEIALREGNAALHFGVSIGACLNLNFENC